MRDALFIMPGGRDLPYVHRLQPEGTQILRSFVEEGGIYLGICAGAYFGASYVEFDKGGQLEVLGSRELQFFPGKAIGPLFGKFRYNSQEGASIVSLEYDDGKNSFFTYSHYNGGCYFEEIDSPGYQPLARYENGKMAIVRCPKKKGFAILSGVHVEVPLTEKKKESQRQLLLQALLAC